MIGIGSSTKTNCGGDSIWSPNTRIPQSYISYVWGKEEEEKKVGCLGIDILNLWYDRSKASIKEKKEIEKGKLIDSDLQVIAIRAHIASANVLIKEYGFENQISINFSNYITKETKDKFAKLIEKYGKESEEVDKRYKEILAMLKMCGDRPDKVAEVLANYGVTDKPFGKLTV